MRLTDKDYCGYDIKDREDFNGYDNEKDNEKLFSCLQKLGQLEDIEEKIGCPLEVLLQVFRKGIWVKSDCTKNKIEHWCAQDIKVIDASWQWDICKIRTTCNKYVGCFNYGKTWALTKEELDK